MSPRKIIIGHRAAREIAFVGPVGVGKTTAVRALSSIEAASTDVMTTATRQSGRRAAGRKTTTTVALDYGEWRSDRGTVMLFGTPGQSRFRSSRDRLMPASTAIVLLLYGNTSYALEEAAEWLRFIDAAGLGSRLTVVVTRLGQPAEPHQDGEEPEQDDSGERPESESVEPISPEKERELLAPFERYVAEIDPRIQVLAGDPRNSDDVARIVEVALRAAPATSPRIDGSSSNKKAAGSRSGTSSREGEAKA